MMTKTTFVKIVRYMYRSLLYFLSCIDSLLKQYFAIEFICLTNDVWYVNHLQHVIPAFTSAVVHNFTHFPTYYS